MQFTFFGVRLVRLGRFTLSYIVHSFVEGTNLRYIMILFNHKGLKSVMRELFCISIILYYFLVHFVGESNESK